MHALGILELLIPEFHGIDALVIRDAYHRYNRPMNTPSCSSIRCTVWKVPQSGSKAEWAMRLGTLLRDLPHAPVLYLMALLHDTGKGRSTGDHAQESARDGA